MADITAARHNNLQSRIALIYGNGAGQNGYGQALQSYQVSTVNEKVIEAADINAIYKDIVNARIHQTGSIPAGIAEVVPDLNVIAEDVSYEVTNQGITQTDSNGAAKGIADFEVIMDAVENDKFIMHPTQATLDVLTSSSRTTPWNGTVYHEFKVIFQSSDHRRHYFNTGGELRITTNNSGANLPKGQDWNQMLQSMGSITFNYASTGSTGVGIGESIGNYQLTSTYQTIFTYVGGGALSGIYSGVYGGNVFTIKAKEETDDSITFQILFQDLTSDGFVDNNVDGRLETVVQQYRADSEEVSVDSPTFDTIQSLSQFATPPEDEIEDPITPSPTPTYTLTTNKASINEGDTVTFTLNTTGVQNGTTVAFGLSGTANTLDVVLSDTSFTVQNNVATVIAQAAQDATTEGDETLTLYLVNSPSTAATVTIKDTSTTELEVFSFTIDETQYLSTSPGWDIGNVVVGVDTFIEITLRGQTGEGIVTVQETSRPTGWNVAVDDDYSGSEPSQIASKNYTLSAGETKTVRLTVQPGFTANFRNVGRYFSFAALKSDGTGNNYTIYWTGAGVSQPSYQLYTQQPTVYEGGTAVFRLETDNVTTGTIVPWQISGISSADVDNVSLTGNFEVGPLVSSSTGVGDSFNLFISDDGIVEPDETLTLTINPPDADPVSTTITLKDPIEIPAGTIAATPTTKNITTAYSESSQIDFTLTASSTGPVTINGLSEYESSEFGFGTALLTTGNSVLTLPHTLAAGESVKARVYLVAPASIDTESTSLYVQTDSNNLILPINWDVEVINPVLTMIPTIYSTTSEWGENTSTQRFVLKAEDATVTISAYEIQKVSGDGVASFTNVSPSRDTPISIPPGTSTYFDISQQFNVGEDAEYNLVLDTNIGIKTIRILWSKSTPVVPTYTITANKTTLTEGDTVDFTIERDITTVTEYVYAGTILNTATADDFSVNGPDSNGEVFFYNGRSSAVTSLTVADDGLIEGTESFRVGLYSDPAKTNLIAVSQPVNIGDAITIPTYNMSYTTTHPTYDNVINEGQYQANILINTTGVPDGTVLYWTTNKFAYDITGEDFTDGLLQGSVTINNNTASLIRSARADGLTEGVEVFSIWLRTGSTSGPVVATTPAIGITDTSTYVAPTVTVINSNYSFSSRADETTNAVIQMRSTGGDSLINSWSYDVLTPTGLLTNIDTGLAPISLPEGQVIDIPVTLSLSSAYQSGTETTANSRVIFNTTGGTKYWNVSYNRVVEDPTYALQVSASYIDDTTANFSVATTNVANGTVLYITIDTITDVNYPVTINNGSGSFSIDLSDSRYPADDGYVMRLRTGSATGPVVNTKTFSIVAAQSYDSISYIGSEPWSLSEANGTAYNFTGVTTNVPSGQIVTVQWQVNGVTLAADATLTNGSGFAIQIKLSDTDAAVVETGDFIFKDPDGNVFATYDGSLFVGA